jgi:hypothetical protein
MRRVARALGLACALAFTALAVQSAAVPARSVASPDAAARAQKLIFGLDYDDARRVLSEADGDDAAVLLERARLALYEMDCDGAALLLGRRDVAAIAASDPVADVARGCQRVTAATVVDQDAARGIEVRWQDEHDRALGPLLMDTVAAAREELSRDLGVDWPSPTRVVVVRDLASLSAMTGLPYESAQTTGTVAVAKWGRVTLLSPRASHHGYDWRDTVAHELTHLALTRATGDRAPLWLQEGVAKREQVMWRRPGPFDDRPPPDDVVARGFELKLGIPLDKLGPSIAMLPSADMATVAFAEVTSFIQHLVQTVGPEVLPRLLGALKAGMPVDAALVSVSGADLSTWDKRWRAEVAASPHGRLSDFFGLGAPHEDAAKMRDLRERVRLAELLGGREHPAAALEELDAVGLMAAPVPAGRNAAESGEPSLRWLRGRLLEAAGRRGAGAWLVADAAEVVTSYGPWWALRGRWAALSADTRVAAESFAEAVAADPLDPESACGTFDPLGLPTQWSDATLCAASRAYPPSPFDAD